jgi:hypothetical protein
MQGGKRLSRLSRLTALLLALVWLGAGLVATALGFLRGNWLLLPVGLFSVVYGVLWLRVVARSRLLSWHEFVVPWRSAAQSSRSEVTSRSRRS